jgi:hypothetical protein
MNIYKIKLFNHIQENLFKKYITHNLFIYTHLFYT